MCESYVEFLSWHCVYLIAENFWELGHELFSGWGLCLWGWLMQIVLWSGGCG